MNDRLFLFGLLYLILASTFIGLMPDEFFSGGSKPTEIDGDDLIDDIPTGVTEIGKGFSFWGKVLTFMFVPIVIDGLPSLIALMLQLFHLLIMISTIIYGVKLFWSGV